MTDEKRVEARGSFLFGEPDGFLDAFTERLDGPLHAPLSAFRANLSSAILVGNIPYRLAHTSVLDQRFNQLLAAERIRALKSVPPGEPVDVEGEEVALRSANSRMDTETQQPEIITRHAKQTLRLLDHHLLDKNFRSSAQELLRQTLVICWGAFEIFVNDLLRLLINKEPNLIKFFVDAKPYRDILSGRTLLDALEVNNFDLSIAMGDVFCDLVKLDSLEKIRDAVSRALSHATVDTTLKDERLWRISQQRHLIVHRRGIVDARYIERTSDRAEIGSHIEFGSEYIEASIILIRDAGCSVFDAAQEKLRRGTSIKQ